MTLTEADIKRILDGTEGVTEGPWLVHATKHPWRLPAIDQRQEKNGFHTENQIVTEWEHPQLKSPYPVVCLSYGLDRGAMVGIDEVNAAHIARCDPDTIRALCELALDGMKYRALEAKEGE